MGSLASIYIKKETLAVMLKTVESKNEKGFEMTVSVNDDTNQFGQNVSAFAAQTREQREAKKSKYYVGNGKVFWTDGVIKTAEKVEAGETNTAIPTATPVDTEDLPF